MAACLFCGSTTHSLFSARDYATADPTERTLNWCERCDFGRLDGHFTPELIASFYPPNYYTHKTDQSHIAPHSFIERLLTHLAWRFDRGSDFNPTELPSGKTVCDIGCGSGDVLRSFKLRGFETTGIEPDPEARKAASDAGHIVAGTAEDLPTDVLGRHFDFVIMSHVLEHCIDPGKAISNAKRLLSPDGTLIVEVPNNGALGFKWFMDVWPWTDIPRHLNFFTATSLKELLSRNHLTITNTKYTGFTRQFGPSWREAQRDIWMKIRSTELPNFTRYAWWLLLVSMLAEDSKKYDSIRVHAKHDA